MNKYRNKYEYKRHWWSFVHCTSYFQTNRTRYEGWSEAGRRRNYMSSICCCGWGGYTKCYNNS